MTARNYQYIVVGGGLAGASAVEGIRERDKQGSVLLISREAHLPYDRPPLSKKLWFGKKTLESIFLHDGAYYHNEGISVQLATTVTAIDSAKKTVTDDQGKVHGYDKLLLATGGAPRRLAITGGDLDGISYFRTLDDYLLLRQGAKEGATAVVIGGGFIGSEIAAALAITKVKVTMLFPEPYLVSRVFPAGLGKAIQERYREKGVTILNGETPVSFSRKESRFVTVTSAGRSLESDLVVVGIGIQPSLNLAEKTGIRTGNGIVVNELLQTSIPDIYAAGDNAFFPYQALETSMRVEHWDNALNQGKAAGRNMAGAASPYAYMPYFFSDLFEFGYEAVGEVDARLDVVADWVKENDTGVLYYLKGGKVRGAMMCNVWEKVEAARQLIRSGETVAPASLIGRIR